MAILSRAALLLAVPAASTAQTRPPASQQVWLLSKGDGAAWCSFPSLAQAKRAGANGKYDEGTSARLRYRGSTIESVVITSESEDAFAEDSYSFTPDLRLQQVQRRGHYINDPVFTVAYLPDPRGKLALTPESRRIVAQQEAAQQETYFLDWPLYPTFARLPFAGLVKAGKAVASSCVKAVHQP